MLEAELGVEERSEGLAGPNGEGLGKDRYARTFDVLELLVGHPAGMTVTEISKRLGLPISSCHNLLQRMVATEVVNLTDELRYSLGARAVRLGIRIVDGLEVRAIARRHLVELARTTGEDVYLAVKLGRRVTYVDRVPGSRPVTVEIRLGQSLYLHATSVGKLFAAYEDQLRRRMLSGARPVLTEHTVTDAAQLERELDRIGEQGFAVSREEAVDGVVGLAVPICDAGGNLVAAIHISALRAQVTPEQERGLLEAAAATAAAVERELGRAPSAPSVMGSVAGGARARA
jgi:DNA-binding IclR family transcriptional regulator